MIFNIEVGMKNVTPSLDSNYPADVTVTNGTEAKFEAVVTEEGIPKDHVLQWYVDGTAIEGATEPTYVRDTSGDKGVLSVWCEVTNKAGTVRTRNAVLTVNKLPVLNGSYPKNATMKISESTKLEVRIAEDGFPSNYTYQWYNSSGAISGATSPTYTYTSTRKGKETFYCVVTNEAGSVQSRTATVTKTEYWLYKDGTEHKTVTIFNPVEYAGVSFNGNIVKNSALIRMEGNGVSSGHGVRVTADVTKFSKFKVLMTLTGEHLANGAVWVASTSNPQHNGALAIHTFDQNTQYPDSLTVTIDVSGLSGNRCMCVGHWSASHILGVHRMWLE